MTTPRILRIAFDQWFRSYFIEEKRIDTYVDLAHARGSFHDSSGMQCTTQFFRTLINLYCNIHNYSLNPENAKGFDKKYNRILMRINHKVVEFIYIGKDDTVIIQKKTFQVLIDYPGSDFQKGQIIEVIEGRFTVRIRDVECSFDLDYFLKYPDIFKEL